MVSTKVPFLHFEFANVEGKKHPVIFSDPLRIIQIHSVKEIIPALREIEHEVSKGFYAAGYLSYEAAPAFDPAFSVKEGGKMPLLWFGLFREPASLCSLPQSDGTFTVSNWEPDTSLNSYNHCVQAVRDAIERGDTYQVNYTMRLRAKFSGDDLGFYRKLSRAQNSNYSAYLNTGRFRVLSASPELFFRWDGETITTRPMKGTIKRGRWPQEDLRHRRWLEQSEKNRAENMMIVDLLRNDLGRVAEKGSVQVTGLCEVERYPTVYQMTSTIKAATNDHITLRDILSALFPCGSITGAPKVSTMNIIADLESSPREVYCGAIGYITPQGEAIFNVPIRTTVIDTETGIAEYGVGGGITWDSTAEGEYEEVLTKAVLLTEEHPEFQLLESLRLENGKYWLLERHLQRLQASADYFQFHVCPAKVQKSLSEYARMYPEDVYKVRLLVSKEGTIRVEGQPVKPIGDACPVALASEPISGQNRFLYHKTTNRGMYESQRRKHPNVFDVLLWNEAGELTEFTIGNLVVEMNGKKFTPSQECGLLAGTLRAELLDSGEIEERVLTLDDLKTIDSIWLINSVRGWVPVRLLKQTVSSDSLTPSPV
ncbi:aminodeoxychorismate synthase component I [Paenactinomyces guangxiensis]|uniref:Aminodeoxychorismate synthase component I n=1 Tax=Paenactinomyces guangxiensis TaxID=1490290 RepID=A0A7W1WTC2_9BACL|nr:aminodeoxychorismate synthase component I [Paenactinomyces guangxiensis]MBA4495667.1 aminodeoxychorismate synthase component I [Paenactinomyces guangxiensis]MBH8592655.1 aminodeoxychorismate synthase component I [Paenactinomyces guangxiensis]